MSGSITQLVTELTPAAVAERMARHLPRLEAITSRYPVKRAALLPALWLAQEEFGWVPRTAIAWAAERCGVAPVHAFGLVEFHSLYRQAPLGRYLIQVCQTMCCHLQGAEALVAHLEKTLGISAGQTTADGLFSLLRVECLALCGTGLGVMINDQAIGAEPHALDEADLHEGHLAGDDFHPTPAILDRWLDFLRAEAKRNPQPTPITAAPDDLTFAPPTPLPTDYAPPAPALKVQAKEEGGAIVITWRNDPLCARVAVEKSLDGGKTWLALVTVGPRDQRAADSLPPGATAHYRVIAQEQSRTARPSAMSTVTASQPEARG
jgi:NADH-quinone oxidoreductase subunit E